jgi:hypothetical protein
VGVKAEDGAVGNIHNNGKSNASEKHLSLMWKYCAVLTNFKNT